MVGSRGCAHEISELQWCLLCVDTSVAMSTQYLHCSLDPTDVDETLFEMMDRTQLEASSRQLSDSNSLQTLVYKALVFTSCFNTLDIDRDRLHDFLEAVSKGYNNLPFHNVLHVQDVVGRMTVLLTAEDCPRFTAIQNMALIIGAAVHDLDHFGMSNTDLVKSRHPLAQRHPTSPMEHHHYECFQDMVKSTELNFLHAFKKEEQVEFDRLVKFVIISTDIGSDFLSLQNDNFDDALAQMKLLMRCADIGHCGSPWHLHFRWAERLCNEHAEEDGFMTAEFKRDQLAFMQKVASPTFQKLSEVIPDAKVWYARCLGNTERWEGAVPLAMRAQSKGVEGEYDSRAAICVS